MIIIVKMATTIFTLGIVTVHLNNFTTDRNSNRQIQVNHSDTIVKQFNRNGLLYIDKKIKNKLVSRCVYLGSKLFYKYPVTRENAGKGVIKLLSGNNFLKSGIVDTIQLSNYLLPSMNRAIYMRGGQISRLSDSSYLVKSNSKIGTWAVFVIMASDNYEEIKNRTGFAVDSLVLRVE
jgi:hypothetical protein